MDHSSSIVSTLEDKSVFSSGVSSLDTSSRIGVSCIFWLKNLSFSWSNLALRVGDILYVSSCSSLALSTSAFRVSSLLIISSISSSVLRDFLWSNSIETALLIILVVSVLLPLISSVLAIGISDVSLTVLDIPLMSVSVAFSMLFISILAICSILSITFTWTSSLSSCWVSSIYTLFTREVIHVLNLLIVALSSSSSFNLNHAFSVINIKSIPNSFDRLSFGNLNSLYIILIGVGVIKSNGSSTFISFTHSSTGMITVWRLYPEKSELLINLSINEYTMSIAISLLKVLLSKNSLK